jgi:predicted enzyme related to lactoylglutathione lyase
MADERASFSADREIRGASIAAGMMAAALVAMVTMLLTTSGCRRTGSTPCSWVRSWCCCCSETRGIIDHERRWLRIVTNLMIALIAVSNLWSAVRLVDGILDNAAFNSQATQLLGIGAVVWATNASRSPWYWDVDGGGSAVPGEGRADPARLPEMNMPAYVGKRLVPTVHDYLALSFNTATAFSPTDVSAVKRWAKMLMIVSRRCPSSSRPSSRQDHQLALTPGTTVPSGSEALRSRRSSGAMHEPSTNHSLAAGTPCWLDVSTPDIDAAQAFYGPLLGWSFGAGDPDFGGYCMCEVDGLPAAGMGPATEGMPPAWTLYFSTDDVAASVAAVPGAGGTVLSDVMPIGDAGAMAIASDPAGAAFGLWQAAR